LPILLLILRPFGFITLSTFSIFVVLLFNLPRRRGWAGPPFRWVLRARSCSWRWSHPEAWWSRETRWTQPGFKETKDYLRSNLLNHKSLVLRFKNVWGQPLSHLPPWCMDIKYLSSTFSSYKKKSYSLQKPVNHVQKLSNSFEN